MLSGEQADEHTSVRVEAVSATPGQRLVAKPVGVADAGPMSKAIVGRVLRVTP
jgi:hypothetical protein